MPSKDPFHLRPQDVLVLLKLIVWKDKAWRQIDLAQSIGVSQAEIANALERLRRSKLVDDSKRKVLRLAATEFLVHALKYLAPGELGSPARGIPTARSAKPISQKLSITDEHQIVWPHSDGSTRGSSLTPIYSSAPDAALRDPELHEWLSLVDSLRIGKSREVALAEKEIRRRIGGASSK
jgi:hypothetical protein